MACELELTRGYKTVIDEEDYERVMQFKWHVAIRRNLRYAARKRTLRHDGREGTEMLHRFILGVTDPRIKVDHINHNGLDNRKENLRQATNAQNLWNSGLRKNNVSGFKGVSWDKEKEKWVVQIRCGDKGVRHIGRFLSKEEAAVAYEIAALKYHGEFANATIFLSMPRLRARD